MQTSRTNILNPFFQEVFQMERICERYQQIILQRLIRVNSILRIMVQQFEVLETMGSIGFASFRSLFKGGASGFQSTQFRILEHILGIREEQRTCTFMKTYNAKLNEEQRSTIEREKSEGEDLMTLVDRWLSRTPAMRLFVTSYKEVIDTACQTLRENTDEETVEERKAEADEMEDRFSYIFDSTKFVESSRLQQGRKLSYEAFIGALMITCYNREPRFTVPYAIIQNLIDMDIFLAKWRFAHVMMVKRIIGGKPGTGGSGGYTYLRSTVSDRYMPFKDLFEVSTFVIPPQMVPTLTPIMVKEISDIYISERDEEKETSSDGSQPAGWAWTPLAAYMGYAPYTPARPPRLHPWATLLIPALANAASVTRTGIRQRFYTGYAALTFTGSLENLAYATGPFISVWRGSAKEGIAAHSNSKTGSKRKYTQQLDLKKIFRGAFAFVHRFAKYIECAWNQMEPDLLGRCNPLVCAAAAPRNEGIEANAARAFVLSSKQSKITLRSRIRRCFLDPTIVYLAVFEESYLDFRGLSSNRLKMGCFQKVTSQVPAGKPWFKF
eukprot:sb/3463587/